ADGAAAHRHRMGTRDRAGLRVLLRAALPVRPGQEAAIAGGGRRRRLRTAPARHAGDGRRSGRDRRRADRRRGTGEPRQTAGRRLAGGSLPVLRPYRLPCWWAPLLPGVALLYAGMTVDSAWRHVRGRGGAWKGRTAPDR